MRQIPTQAVLPPSILSESFLQSVSPSPTASHSVAQYSAGLAHDARNMLAAMDIYCELLGSPGVLKAGDKHLLDELRLLRDSSGKLLDRLLIEALKCLASSEQAPTYEQSHSVVRQSQARMNTGVSSRTSSASAAILYDPGDTQSTDTGGFPQTSIEPASNRIPVRGEHKRIVNLAAELQSSLPMLSALAGPRVHVSLALESCPEGELFIPQVDLTRVLINLVRNAAEAMAVGGRIIIGATPVKTDSSCTGNVDGTSQTAVMLSIEDNGPGIPLSLLDRIFDLHVSGKTQEESTRPRMQFRPRGLGLRIVREFVEASSGTIRALRLPDRGSRFEIVLPMVTKVRRPI